MSIFEYDKPIDWVATYLVNGSKKTSKIQAKSQEEVIQEIESRVLIEDNLDIFPENVTPAHWVEGMVAKADDAKAASKWLDNYLDD